MMILHGGIYITYVFLIFACRDLKLMFFLFLLSVVDGCIGNSFSNRRYIQEMAFVSYEVSSEAKKKEEKLPLI